MKQFIVMLAILPILLAFSLQFALDQVNHSRQLRFEEAVHSFRLIVAGESGFSEDNVNDLVTNVAGIYAVPASSIGLAFGTEARGGHTFYTYRITAPVRKIFAGNRLFGIRDSENAGVFAMEGAVADINELIAAFVKKDDPDDSDDLGGGDPDDSDDGDDPDDFDGSDGRDDGSDLDDSGGGSGSGDDFDGSLLSKIERKATLK